MSLHSSLELLKESPEYERILASLRSDKAPVWLEALAGTAKAFVLAGLSEHTERVLLIVTSDEENAENLAADLPAFGIAPAAIGLYPASEADIDEFVPSDKVLASSVAPERQAMARTRISVLEALAAKQLRVVVAPVTAALRETIGPLDKNRIVVDAKGTLNPSDLAHRLVEMGYERLPLVEAAGHFAMRGGLIDLWPSTRSKPVRIELFGDDIESIKEFDPESQLSGAAVDSVTMLPTGDNLQPAATVRETYTLLEHLPAGSVVVLDEPNHLRSRWQEARDRDRQRQEALQAKAEEKAVAPRPVNTGIEMDEFLRRCQSFRLVVTTLLSQTLPWLRKLMDQCEKAALSSGIVDPANGDIPTLANRVRSWLGIGTRVIVASDQPHRVVELLAEQGLPASAEAGHARLPGAEVADEVGRSSEVSDSSHRSDSSDKGVPSGEVRSMPHIPVVHGRLSAGFRLLGIKLLVLSDNEIFQDIGGKRRLRGDRGQRKFKDSRPIISLLELKVGDLVVHTTHGIGRFRGLVTRTGTNGLQREFLHLEYAEPDKLFVPSDQLDRVQKYIGSDENPPSIHKLGGTEWARTKSKVAARVKEMAKELVALYAQRQATPGYQFDEDTVWQEEMEASFPYRETNDQLTAIKDTKRDMEQPRPMDRLVCGDVGYGKTEVAIRAAFKAVQEGKQVAVLVPTTVLAQQHSNTFSERLSHFPVKIALLSRFQSPKEIKESLQGIEEGSVDIAIGTHRLLSKDVKFHDLGLLIVDEEQRFGVAHKERLKQMKANVDALTLTATPIPRTLHMSLAGLRDMSVIEEPPEGRLAVRTYCLESDDDIVKEAILRELDRGGQIYYVHNRIDTIYREAERLQKLAPQARIRVGHGQMKDTELEDVMVAFYEGEFDILCCTTIIESGLDIPNCNTICINNADQLGLSQLHQLRGRVGRSSRQAYCYLLYKPFKELSETAEKRLAAVREFTDLGAGFRIAMRDMEIRGTGNLLGAEQHGQMVSVGYELFCEMIDQAVKELQGKSTAEQLLPSVTLPLSALIPADYIPTDGLRIAFYKKVAGCRIPDDVDRVQAEFEDRFGDPPEPVWNLLAIMRLRIDAPLAGIGKIDIDKGTVILWMARKIEKDEARELMRHNRRIQVQNDRLLMYFNEGEKPLRAVEQMVKLLKKGGGKAAAQAVQKQLRLAETLASAK